MRVAPGLYLAASGAAGFSITGALDCNVWLIDTGEGLALFDTGAGQDVEGLIAQLHADGLDLAQLRHIFLTHAHADHSGGAVELMRRAPAGTVLYAGREAADRMAANDETRISLDRARSLGIYPPSYQWRGTEVGRVIGDDETVRIGRAAIRLLHTPGHSDDNCAYFVQLGDRRVLIAGDTVFAGGKIVLQDIPDSRVAESLSSIRRVAALEFETFLPGHGLFSIQDGRRHVLRARDYADTGLPPPSFF